MAATLRELVAGVIFGTAIGDALGYQVEFNGMEQIYDRFGPEGVTGFDGEARFSDDTQMMVATFEGLMRARTWSDLEAAAEEVAEEYVAWSRSPENNRAPGNACMEGCRQLANGVEWKYAGKKDGKGCGTAMRSMAYGVWFHRDHEAAALWAAQHALMTHRSKVAMAAAAAMAAGTSVALGGKDSLFIAGVMVSAAGRYDKKTADMLTLASQMSRNPGTLREVLDEWRGWRGDEAVAAALYVFLSYPDNYRAGVLAAATSPGDSDSIACMAGALIGARRGVDAIPGEWLEVIEKSHELAALSERVERTLDHRH